MYLGDSEGTTSNVLEWFLGMYMIPYTRYWSRRSPRPFGRCSSMMGKRRYNVIITTRLAVATGHAIVESMVVGWGGHYQFAAWQGRGCREPPRPDTRGTHMQPPVRCSRHRGLVELDVFDETSEDTS